jgi:hypothetical protein
MRTQFSGGLAAPPDGGVEFLPQSLKNLRQLLAEVEPSFPSAAERGYRAVSAST